jgi:hypothetical protein
VKSTGRKSIGTLLFAPHARYFVEAATRERAHASWIRRVVVPAVFSALLTIIALIVLFAIARLITPDPPVSRLLDCVRGECPTAQTWTPW